MSDHPDHRSTYFARLVRVFWQGATQPCVGAALGAVGVVLAGVVLLVAGSTEARVRETAPTRWLTSYDDDYGRLTAFAIQGASRHARGTNPTIVFVGSSLLQALLPNDAELDQTLTAGFANPVSGLNLSAAALSVIETAAVLERFGGDFEGWVVVGVNRHILARNLVEEEERKKRARWTVHFHSVVLDEEFLRAGIPLPRRVGVALLDHDDFYLRTLAGWRFAGRTPPVYRPMTHAAQRQTIDPGRTLADFPAYDQESFEINMAVLGRMARRQASLGRARLVLVECPMVDEILEPLHTAAWREAREHFDRRRDAWSMEHNVPWVDVAGELGLKPSDYYDPRHVTSPEIRRRFAEIVGRKLAALKQ